MTSNDRLADSLDEVLASLKYISTELRMQRTTLAKISGALGIEIEDREEANRAHGLRLVEHERRLNELRPQTPPPKRSSQDAE